MTQKNQVVHRRSNNGASTDKQLANGLRSSEHLHSRFARDGIKTVVTFLRDPTNFLVFIINPEADQATALIRKINGIRSVEMTDLHDPSIVRINVTVGDV